MNSILKKGDLSHSFIKQHPSIKSVRFAADKRACSAEGYHSRSSNKIYENNPIRHIDFNNNNNSLTKNFDQNSNHELKRAQSDYIEIPIQFDDDMMVAINKYKTDSQKLGYSQITQFDFNANGDKNNNTTDTVNMSTSTSIVPSLTYTESSNPSVFVQDSIPIERHDYHKNRCLIDYPLHKPVNNTNVNTNQKQTENNKKEMDDKVKGKYKQWYKEMYTSLHKEEKPDAEDANPYKPTYKFPSSKDDELYNCLDECFNQPYITTYKDRDDIFKNCIDNSKSSDTPFKKMNHFNDAYVDSAAKFQSTSSTKNTNSYNTPPNNMSTKSKHEYEYEYKKSSFSTDTRPNVYKIVQDGGDIPILGLQKYLNEKTKDKELSTVNYNKITSLRTQDSNFQTRLLNDYQYVTEHKRTLKQVRFLNNNHSHYTDEHDHYHNGGGGGVGGISRKLRHRQQLPSQYSRVLQMSKSLNNLNDKFNDSDQSDDDRCVITGSGYIVRGQKDEILNLNNIPNNTDYLCSAQSMNDLLLIDNVDANRLVEEGENSTCSSVNSDSNRSSLTNSKDLKVQSAKIQVNKINSDHISLTKNDTDSQFSDSYFSESKNPENNATSDRTSNTNSNSKYLAKAIALHNFKPINDKELPFKKGDIIIVHKQITEHWYLGEQYGNVGLFPENYVKFYDISVKQSELNAIRNQMLSMEGLGKAKYDFFPQAGEELELRRGDLVSIIRRVDANWFEGYIGNQQGIFPVQYVALIKEPVEKDVFKPTQQQQQTQRQQEQVQQKTLSGEKTSTESVYHSYSNTSNYTSDDSFKALNSKDHMFIDTSTPRSVKPYSLLDYSNLKPEMFSAIYAYKAKNESEIDINRNDLILVYKMCDNDWYIGLSLQTGKFGKFPGNYVMPHQIYAD